jgi:hypothetical protein
VVLLHDANTVSDDNGGITSSCNNHHPYDTFFLKLVTKALVLVSNYGSYDITKIRSYTNSM